MEYVGIRDGSFRLYVSDNGFVWIDVDGRYYKFVNIKIINDLLCEIKKQWPNEHCFLIYFSMNEKKPASK